MSDYTSYGYEIVRAMTSEDEIFLVPSENHRGVIELTEDDLLLMLSVLRTRRDELKKG